MKLQAAKKQITYKGPHRVHIMKKTHYELFSLYSSRVFLEIDIPWSSFKRGPCEQDETS